MVNLVWHYAVTAYVGQPAPGPLYPIGSTLTAAVVMALFIGLFKAIAALVRWVTAHVGRRVAKVKTARLIATVLTVVVVGGVLDQVVARGLLAAAKAQADAANANVPGGLTAPTSALRSGGPGSLVTWDSIGADGKTFIGSGPTAQEITAAVNERAKEPIRVFVAVDNNRTLEQTRDLAIAELDRTGGLDRKAVLVVASTSTGFVNEWAAESFEYLLRGDTAIVTMQYSTLPSALALITSRKQPPLVGRMLFDAVATRVSARPEGTRPKLYAGGESLGAYGGNGAFDSPADMLAKVDGALWTGTPSFTDLHAELTESRTFGSTTIDPTIEDGRHTRFAGDVPRLSADEYGHTYSPWEAPRVAYLQHDNDPVVWWSPSLLLSTPDLAGGDPHTGHSDELYVVAALRDLLAGERRHGDVELRPGWIRPPLLRDRDGPGLGRHSWAADRRRLLGDHGGDPRRRTQGEPRISRRWATAASPRGLSSQSCCRIETVRSIGAPAARIASVLRAVVEYVTYGFAEQGRGDDHGEEPPKASCTAESTEWWGDASTEEHPDEWRAGSTAAPCS